MIQIRVIVLLAIVASGQVLGSAIKGGLEHAPTKGGPLLEAPAAKGRALERQVQRIETVEEPLPKEQLKATQEELQVSQVEEVRSSKGGARKLAEPSRKETGELLAEQKLGQQKLDEQQQVQLHEEIKQQRFEARPQIQQEFQQAPLELIEQQRADYEKQEPELRLPEEQRKIPEPLPVQQQAIYQQKELQQQEEQVKIGQAEAEPYSFSYSVDGSSRSESGDTRGVVRGQYTLRGADGSRRIVDYVADQDGFRASVNTNEFGTEAQSPAGVALRSSQPSAEDITLRLEGKTRESLQAQVTEQYREQSLGTKGYAPAAPAAPLAPLAPAPVKGLPQLLPVLQEQEPIPAPVKRAPEPARKEAPASQEPARTLEESNKSAELVRREPKALKAPEQSSRVVKEARSSFESATAHREYRAPQAPRQVLRSQQVAPSVRYQPSVAVRPQYQPARQYPPSPVQAVGYRRYPSAERNPRVSFYSAPSIPVEEELPISGFDSRSA